MEESSKYKTPFLRFLQSKLENCIFVEWVKFTAKYVMDGMLVKYCEPQSIILRVAN